ncbi:MAG: AI-2E family transporter [Paracoccaceae bacterium]
MDKPVQTTILFIGFVVLVAALIQTRDLSAPMALALALGVILAPLSDRLERYGLSTAGASLTSLALTLLLMGGLLLVFQPIVMALVEAAPKVLRDVQALIDSVRGIARGLSHLSQEVSSAVAVAGPAVAETTAPAAEATEVPIPTLADALMLAPAVAAQVMTFTGTLFFFLLGRQEIYDYAARNLSAPDQRAVTARRLRSAEATVSRYFLTITLVNAMVGLATFGMLAVIGLPNAALWGVLAFVLNYVVYLGPLSVAVALLFSGVAVFDGIMALLPGAAFVTINVVEGQFLTPAFVGRQSALNPLLVFLAILFGIWVWGPIGGIVAIPLILWLRVLANGEAPAPQAAKPVAAAQG